MLDAHVGRRRQHVERATSAVCGSGSNGCSAIGGNTPAVGDRIERQLGRPPQDVVERVTSAVGDRIERQLGRPPQNVVERVTSAVGVNGSNVCSTVGNTSSVSTASPSSRLARA